MLIESVKLNVYLFTHVMYGYLFLMDHYLGVYQDVHKTNIKKQMLKQTFEVQSGALLNTSDIISHLFNTINNPAPPRHFQPSLCNNMQET